MKFDLDEYANLDSVIHQWDPRYKLVGLFALIFSFAMVTQVQILPAMAIATVILYRLAKFPLSFWLTRIRYPSLFLLGIVVILPFVSGTTVLWQWGWISLRTEGLTSVAVIACRFLSILTVSLVLFGSSTFLDTVRALRSLGLPSILTDMMLLSYRYLYEIAGTLSQMQQAMRLRGFGQYHAHHDSPANSSKHPIHSRKDKRLSFPTGRTLRTIASLTGTLLIRSYEQSERVYQAMRLRGYGSPQSMAKDTVLTWQTARPWDAIALGITLLLAASFAIAQFFSSQ